MRHLGTAKGGRQEKVGAARALALGPSAILFRDQSE